MAQPERTKAQLLIGAIGVAIVTVVVVIVIGVILQQAFVVTYLAVPIGVALGLWFFFSQQRKDENSA